MPRRKPLSSSHTAARQRADAGFSLIEVLVSILVFSIGALGVVGMLASATQNAVQAQDRTRAATLASELISQMWANQTTSLAPALTEAWMARVADATVAGLPSGAAEISLPSADGTVTITITWTAPGSKQTTPSRYVTQVVLPS